MTRITTTNQKKNTTIAGIAYPPTVLALATPGSYPAPPGLSATEKNWRTGPLTQEPGLGQRNWDTSGIEDLLAEAGISAMEFVLRFTLSHPGLSTTIVGTANPGHLAGNIAIAEKGPLPADLYEEAKKLLPR